jgi:L-ribulokinase
MNNHAKYVLGLDFSTMSGRAVLVRVSDGREMASAVHYYANGVITNRLPNCTPPVKLPAQFALQDPKDYLDVLKTAVPAVMNRAGVRAEDIIGIGTCFTASTVMPVESDGTPLCSMPKWRSNPHAWVKLWSHRAAQSQADLINEVARKRGEEFLKRYSGRYSSGWFFSKVLEIVEKAPEVYEAADEFIEASDWIVWQLVGRSRRNNSAAGYKAMWLKDKGGYPRFDFFKALHPKLEHVLDEKLGDLEVYEIGANAGGLSRKGAALTGLKEGTPVAVGIVDAHAAVPGCGVIEPGKLCMVMGPRICHVLLARERRDIEGVGGCVEDGIVPGMWGYEAGQTSGGELLAWFCEALPAEIRLAAERRRLTVARLMEERAAALKPGQCGVLALDWWSGNQCVLMDPNLSGLLLGLTAKTQRHEIYRALIEATAFGARKIMETFTKAGLEINELVACGGLPDENKLLMQIFSDVSGKPVRVAESPYVAALGAAMHGAVAAGKTAGGYPTLHEAARHMARVRTDCYRPHKASHEIYNQLYAEYEKLHDYFGRGANPVLKMLKRLKNGAA